MISEETGSLLDAPADALVNTVNTAGVMGKVLALEPGVPGQPRYLVNFPTKGHWRDRSSLDDIRQGLADLRRLVLDLGITSIAVPPLGCGNAQ
jgi:O-acetyl-ADP-ribose deacetylase (regulator of RNase III)